VALRDAGHEITWVVEAPYRELVETVARVRTIPVSLKKWGGAPWASRSAMAAARRAMRGFDRSVDVQGLVKSAALAWLGGAPARYGFARNAIREKAALLFTNRHVEVDPSLHVIEQNLALARAAGATALTPPPVDFTPFAAGHFPALRGNIVLLPGAGKPNKQWPVERFRELARRLGERAVVVWGPGEEERAVAVDARMAPRTNLRELASILRDAALVIGGDTGPLHLAAALGTPVIGLYGPTNERRNGPYGQLDRCISTFGGAKTMEAISVEAVLAKVQINPV
jgi:heptosyltransferase-1